MLLCTAGHVDHGKTSLIKALTGVDADRLPEEKRRGLTIDLGFAALDLKKIRLGIVDVPGHERYVKNMLAGATGVNLAMLVVAADEGVMPQTVEHFEALRHLRISTGVIAMTKVDLVDDDMIALVGDDITQLVAGSFFEHTPIVEVSAKTGKGIPALRDHLEKAADSVSVGKHDGPFRLIIDRCFSSHGFGTVVTGSVVRGRLTCGDQLELLPNRKTVAVRRIESHGVDTKTAEAGQRAALNLTGISVEDVQRGDILATPDSLEPTRLISVWIEPSRQRRRALKKRQGVRFYSGASETQGLLRLLEAADTKSHRILGQVELSDAVCVHYGEPFVVRGLAENEILGGGQVLDPLAFRISPRDASTVRALRDSIDADDTQRVSSLLAVIGSRTWSTNQLEQRAGVRNGSEILQQLTDNATLVRFETKPQPTWLHRSAVEVLERRFLDSLNREHQAKPLHATIPLGHLKKHFDRLDPPDLLAHLAESLHAASKVRFDGKSIAAISWKPKLSARQSDAFAEILAANHAAGLAPPTVGEVATQHDLPVAEAEQLLELAASENILIRLPDKDPRDAKAAQRARLYVHQSKLKELILTLASTFDASEEWTVSQFCDKLGISRKYAIPLCEYLDQCGVTSRKGDKRSIDSSRFPT